jgi:hypothetical protein
MQISKTRIATLALLPALLWLGGCASSVPKAAVQQEIAIASRVSSTDTVAVTVTAADGVEMLDIERARLAEKITRAIDSKKTLNARDGAPRDYAVEVLVSRYEKGNAFARAMLAGLGQIHLDGNVKLLELPARTPAGDFSLDKTFAWGGIYGSSTNIEGIEDTFALGVAGELTGQKEPEEKAKKTSKKKE